MTPTRLLAGRTVATVGQGTWKMADRPASRAAEIAALQRGVELGLTVIDTAEMYGEGASESLVGEALRGRRDAVTLVSKVYPHNADRRRLPQACAASLRRLGTDRLDLYLLHWRGSVPLAETVEAFEHLRQAGDIAAWGVSNFDVADLEELWAAGGQNCATNQILYNLVRRGPEHDLLPWMARHAVPVMAYSPVEQGRLPANPGLRRVAERHGVTPEAVALAFAIRSGQVVAIPKASTLAHVDANAAAGALVLDVDDLAALDAAFAPPRTKQPLAML